ncbi:MAG: IclR family acetate operon transcriptional repressor [Glaciecola sp.]|jgi:IclR family acetate operon transcriptional repressor
MTSQPQTIAGVERALDVLTLFAREGVASLGVTEVSEALELSKAVVHRILATLRAKDYVELDQSTRRYVLGPRALTLGLSVLDRLDVQDIARGALRELVMRTNETATLSVRAGWSRVYVDQVNPARDIKMVVQLGSSHPLHAGSSSKALLAFLDPELQQAYLDRGEFEAVTSATITSRRALERDLRQIRSRGYAISLGERQEGAGSVAAPILNHEGAVVSVISVCGPLERFRSEVDACAASLLEVTHAVSARLGHRG